MEIVGNVHQGEEAVICVAYFQIICAMGVERREALFHIKIPSCNGLLVLWNMGIYNIQCI